MFATRSTSAVWSCRSYTQALELSPAAHAANFRFGHRTFPQSKAILSTCHAWRKKRRRKKRKRAKQWEQVIKQRSKALTVFTGSRLIDILHLNVIDREPQPATQSNGLQDRNEASTQIIVSRGTWTLCAPNKQPLGRKNCKICLFIFISRHWFVFKAACTALVCVCEVCVCFEVV